MRNYLALALAFMIAIPGAARALEMPQELTETHRAALAELPLLRGEPFAPDALGDEVVIISFFASWCPPCHPEFDHLKAIDARYREEGVRVLSVNIFEIWGQFSDSSRLERFLDAKEPRFAVLGEGMEIAELFGGVTRIPTVLVFGRGGGLLEGFVHEEGASKTHLDLQELEDIVLRGIEG